MELTHLATRLHVWGQNIWGRGIADVYTWMDDQTVCAAFVAKPLYLERLINSVTNNYMQRIDSMLMTCFGITPKRSGHWLVDHFFNSDNQLYFVEIVEGVQSLMHHLYGDSPNVRFTVIPDVGEPFSGKPTRYFSAKKKRYATSHGPKNVSIIEYTDSGGDRVSGVGMSFCNVMKPLQPSMRSHRELLMLNERPALVAHSINLDHTKHQLLNSAVAIRTCGGMLFPSFSVGEIPASSFGPLTLVVDPAVIMDGMKPWKKRGVWPVNIFNTDVWTGTTGEFTGVASVELYQQMTGTWWIGPYTRMHMWVLGPPADVGGPAEEQARRITSVKQLYTAIKRRMKPFEKVKTAQQLVEHGKRFALTVHRYGYLEAKSNTIVPMSWFPVAFCPDWMLNAATLWLSEAGFSGRIYTLPTDAMMRRAHAGELPSAEQDFQMLTWARAIGAYAQSVLKPLHVNVV